MWRRVVEGWGGLCGGGGGGGLSRGDGKVLGSCIGGWWAVVVDGDE